MNVATTRKFQLKMEKEKKTDKAKNDFLIKRKEEKKTNTQDTCRQRLRISVYGSNHAIFNKTLPVVNGFSFLFYFEKIIKRLRVFNFIKLKVSNWNFFFFLDSLEFFFPFFYKKKSIFQTKDCVRI